MVSSYSCEEVAFSFCTTSNAPRDGAMIPQSPLPSFSILPAKIYAVQSPTWQLCLFGWLRALVFCRRGVHFRTSREKTRYLPKKRPKNTVARNE